MLSFCSGNTAKQFSSCFILSRTQLRQSLDQLTDYQIMYKIMHKKSNSDQTKHLPVHYESGRMAELNSLYSTVCPTQRTRLGRLQHHCLCVCALFAFNLNYYLKIYNTVFNTAITVFIAIATVHKCTVWLPTFPLPNFTVNGCFQFLPRNAL